jgi:hypothetical protein
MFNPWIMASIYIYEQELKTLLNSRPGAKEISPIKRKTMISARKNSNRTSVCLPFLINLL